MNDVSLIRTIRNTQAGLSMADKLLSEDLPLCDRFRERRPRAFSEEKSSSRVQRDVCESASKLAEICSKLPREEDEKKSKRVMPMVICFTRQTVYHGHANSQLPTDKARLRHQRLVNHSTPKFLHLNVHTLQRRSIATMCFAAWRKAVG